MKNLVDSENWLWEYIGVQRILFFEDPSAVNILEKQEFNSATNSILPHTGIAILRFTEIKVDQSSREDQQKGEIENTFEVCI